MAVQFGHARLALPLRTLTIAAVLVITVLIPTVFAQSQPPQPPKRTDSITVTEDYPENQMRNEDECDAKIDLGEDAFRQGELEAAQDYFREAWAMTEKYAYLQGRQERLLTNIGTTYIAQRRLADAVASFQSLLDTKEEDCKPEGDYPAGCAKVQVSLGTARVLNGEVAAGMTLINAAVENYRRQVTLDTWDVEKYVHRARQAEAMAYHALLMGKFGDLTKARIIINDAKTTVEQVIADAVHEPGALEAAQSVLAIIMDFAKQIQ